MVLQHFHLRAHPFGVTPDPRYLYPSGTHREALACLLYGIESGAGFVTLIAKPGMGKTTLLFEVLRRINPGAKTVFLFQTVTTPIDLLRALLMDLGVEKLQANLVDLQAQLNEVLIAQHSAGSRVVFVIDEAHNLNERVLEAIRMLSNFETPSHKLMQIVLSGQPQLAEKLAMPQMTQLRQRVSIFGSLEPLSSAETAAYIRHRLHVAGHLATEPIFTAAAVAMIAQYSAGIPRNINNICFNAMSLGCALRQHVITAEMIGEVLADLGLVRPSRVQKPQIPSKSRHDRLARAIVAGWRTDPRMRVSLGVAVACGIVLVFGWLGIEDYRALRADAPVQQDPGVRYRPMDALIDQTPQVTRQSQEPQAQIEQIQQVNSLQNIGTEALGYCGRETLQQMVKMNP
jgi:general secretion pathway protein A